MRIYFAGSIRGGRQDAALYTQIVEMLKEYGEVLTEHVGDPDLSEENLEDEDIHRRDMDWLELADALVAEVTVPSHGVGYEVARAETLGKPILCLHRPGPGRHLSALIAGAPSVRCERYDRMDQLKAILDDFFRRQVEGSSQ